MTSSTHQGARFPHRIALSCVLSEDIISRELRMLRNSWLLSKGVDALGIPDQSRLDRMVGADRTASAGCGAPYARGQASAPSLNAMRYANRDPSRLTAANRASWNPLARTRGRIPALRADWKPSRHGTPRWTRSRWRPPNSLSRSLAGCRSPVSVRLTPKSLFHRALSQSTRHACSHGVMASVSLPLHLP